MNENIPIRELELLLSSPSSADIKVQRVGAVNKIANHLIEEGQQNVEIDGSDHDIWDLFAIAFTQLDSSNSANAARIARQLVHTLVLAADAVHEGREGVVVINDRLLRSQFDFYEEGLNMLEYVEADVAWILTRRAYLLGLVLRLPHCSEEIHLSGRKRSIRSIHLCRIAAAKRAVDNQRSIAALSIAAEALDDFGQYLQQSDHVDDAPLRIETAIEQLAFANESGREEGISCALRALAVAIERSTEKTIHLNGKSVSEIDMWRACVESQRRLTTSVAYDSAVIDLAWDLYSLACLEKDPEAMIAAYGESARICIPLIDEDDSNALAPLASQCLLQSVTGRRAWANSNPNIDTSTLQIDSRRCIELCKLAIRKSGKSPSSMIRLMNAIWEHTSVLAESPNIDEAAICEFASELLATSDELFDHSWDDAETPYARGQAKALLQQYAC